MQPLSKAVVGVGILVLCALVWRLIHISNVPAPVRVGDQVTVKGLDVSARDQTLVVFMTTSCRYCRDSLLWYQTLAAGAFDLNIVVVGRETEAQLRAFCVSHGFYPDSVITVHDDFRVAGVPTTMLVGRDGLIRSLWLGQLNDASEKELTSQLKPRG